MSWKDDCRVSIDNINGQKEKGKETCNFLLE